MKTSSVLTALLALSTLFAGAVQAQTNDGSVKFPELKSTYLKTGDFVNLENLRKVALGQNKDQVRLLLGNPHFSEGIGGSHIWNYAFNFYTGKMGGDYITCQYQVQYDKNTRVGATYWKDKQCDAFINGSAPVAKTPQKINLSADGLFAFGRSGLNDLQPKGRENLRQLAEQISAQGTKLNAVSVVGFTDRIGSVASNMALSRARAQTVKNYFVQQGVPADMISTSGMGPSKPVVNCPGSKSPAVIACLMPNRRIEVTLDGEK